MRVAVTVDVEGVERSDYRSVTAFDDLRSELGVPLTLFVTPGVVRDSPETVRRWIDSDDEVGLHVHPAVFDGNDSDWLSDYDRLAITSMVERGVETFEDVLDHTPRCFRAGRWEYTERLHDALGELGFAVDASLKPTRRTDPFTRNGVREVPASVYRNPVVDAVLRNRSLDALPMAADAFLTGRPLAAGFYGVTCRLLVSDRPYLLISFHDYDILNEPLRSRIRRYVRRVTAVGRATTVDEL